MIRHAKLLGIGTVGLYLTVLLLSAMTGCQSSMNWKKGWKDHFDLSKNIPWPTSREKRADQPYRLACFWNDTILSKPGETPSRGFGGRIYFYDQDGDQPVQVEGQLVVYAFDEANRLPTDNRPTRKYIFPAEQFAKHYSKSDLGPSYSVWLPWDDADGEQKQVSLIARFEPKSGSVIVSQEARQRLPGTPPAFTSPIEDRPQLAAYQDTPSDPESMTSKPMGTESTLAGNSSDQQPKQSMTTSSITLPPRIGFGTPRTQNRKTDAPSKPATQSGFPSSIQPAPTTPSSSDRATSTNQVNSEISKSRLAGFQLAKRLAPEGRVSPPTIFRDSN
ncbi:MAG: hypothetical protein JW829_11560 [Pirellulales bacterium]|nr:hypothetical protein [Pirellulales bacterium]